MDADYSVFSILPPYNNLHAQVVDNSSGAMVTSGVSLTYEPLADPTNSINSHSSGKTNFWTYVSALFGVSLPAEKGLAGNSMPSQSPQPLKFDSGLQMFVAEGIPITPVDDAGTKNPYPLVKVVAKDGSGKQIASARVVLPVSDEMSCKSCHASTSSSNTAQQAARPAAGWIYDGNAERDYRRNILRLHDEKSAGSAAFQSALTAKGYSPGLLASADSGRPVLCAACHASNALPGTGIAGIKPLTQSMHAKHGTVIDPTNGLQLDATSNRSACYQCHPGSTTKCLRGAMSASSMQCQSCHGKMSNVGSSTRVGWFDQPNCQACHHDGKRETTAVSSSGTLNTWSDARFATNANTPVTGVSLYRFSKGHGGLQCESCHGATHAEYSGAAKDPNLPLNHYNDNLFSQDIQGHAGTVEDCKICHANQPVSINGGPHGLHTLGQSWVTGHHDMVKGIQSNCTYCHGADYRGGPLATVKANRSFNIGDGRTKAYTAGQPVGCYDCHNGPSGG
ncbi:MAG: hypothetical protein HGA75_14040 [Thiobacillus sp.]|nr:hypothetical protein [Thiobacillus sp.]